jgi:hypothetical protein
MAWTPWRKVADRLGWYADHALRISVCFELAVGSPYDQLEPVVVYVGAAMTEAGVLQLFDKGEHALQARAQAVLAEDLAIYYRAQGATTLDAAKALCQERLAAGTPEWNG